MIVNLEQFIAEERPKWERLEAILHELSRDPWKPVPLAEARELERLYQRAAADLARISGLAAEPQTQQYLENLVARGHAEIHGDRAERGRPRLLGWFARTLPQTFRRHVSAFMLAVAVTLAGALFGGAAVALDPDAKSVLMPFEHLRESPAERVAHEQQDSGRRLEDRKARFSGMLMTHNTQVTLAIMALGITCGFGTLVMLFYNGVILGAVTADYILGGQTLFLFGWLLPHGVVEIPAMLIGGQAGFVLAGAMLRGGKRQRLADRMRGVMPDLVTLCFGSALLLVWAGVIEAFLSQYHEPIIPYAVKITFGVVELAVLAWYLFVSGASAARPAGKRV